MKRAQLEHLIRAASEVTKEREFIVVGSQAALVTSDCLPKDMSCSPELDMYVPGKPTMSDEIDGALGELSPFHATHGYYGQGVGPETAMLPSKLRDRARRLCNEGTGGSQVIAPDINDLCTSKLIAGRAKDYAYARAALKSGLAKIVVLLDRLAEVADLDAEVRDRVSKWIVTEPLTLGSRRNKEDRR